MFISRLDIEPEGKIERRFRPTLAAARPFAGGTQIDPRRLRTAAMRTDRYDKAWAYTLSVASAWAYSGGQTLADKLRFYGLSSPNVALIAVENAAMAIVATAYFITSDDGDIGILAFRGTEPLNLMNWLTDADTRGRDFPTGGKVQCGFYSNVEVLWDQIENLIGQAMSGNGRQLQALYITGHSLGGAMAVIAGARIFTDDYREWQGRVKGIYTYGQPIVGDAEFVRQCDTSFGTILYRHVYRHDVVARLPPCDVDELVHFGHERRADAPEHGWRLVSDGERTRQCKSTLRTLVSVALDFPARRFRFPRRIDAALGAHFPYSLDDHAPEYYIDTCRYSL